MNTLSKTLMCASIALATSGAFAQDAEKKGDKMMRNDTMSMQDCKKHMAMSKKSGGAADDAMTKKDAMCADMMKKNSGMKADGSASEPMSK